MPQLYTYNYYPASECVKIIELSTKNIVAIITNATKELKDLDYLRKVFGYEGVDMHIIKRYLANSDDKIAQIVHTQLIKNFDKTA